jgi:hypothetical protein
VLVAVQRLLARGEDPARNHGVHPDPPVRPLVRERAHHLAEGGMRRVVAEAVPERPGLVQGPDHGEGRAAPGRAVADQGAEQRERGHRPDPQAGRHRVEGELEGRLMVLVCQRVHRGADRAVVAGGSRDPLTEVLGAGVGDHRGRIVASGPDRLDCLPGGRRVPVHAQHHLVLRRQRECAGGADPAAGPGDDRDAHRSLLSGTLVIQSVRRLELGAGQVVEEPVEQIRRRGITGADRSGEVEAAHQQAARTGADLEQV